MAHVVDRRSLQIRLYIISHVNRMDSPSIVYVGKMKPKSPRNGTEWKICLWRLRGGWYLRWFVSLLRRPQRERDSARGGTIEIRHWKFYSFSIVSSFQRAAQHIIPIVGRNVIGSERQFPTWYLVDSFFSLEKVENWSQMSAASFTLRGVKLCARSWIDRMKMCNFRQYRIWLLNLFFLRNIFLF